MFCPNCANRIEIGQKFCRTCGLKLEDIFLVVAKQIPTKNQATLQKRKDLFDKLGIFSLSCFGAVGIGFLFFQVIYYKLILFGADVLFWSGFAAFAIFGLLAIFFFNYPKLFMNFEKVNSGLLESEVENPNVTNKLLEESSLGPNLSVTENSTELLFIERKQKKSGDSK
jgi:hypothetical protein